MDKNIIRELIENALAARKNAYVPYSRFAVGAALIDTNGNIHTGCNIENSSYGLTNCAERTAFFKAVSTGVKSFTAIAIAGGPADKELKTFAPPCGACRQVMREFCNPETFDVVLATDADNYRCFKLKELLPESFGPENL